LKKKISGLALLTIMLAMPMMISSVEATEWVEVTRRSGSAHTSKEFSMQFECNHVEWRIRWSYEAEGAPFESTLLIQGINPLILATLGYSSRSGVRVCNGTGNHNLEVTCIGMNEYTIVIEEDVDSIPEFPSWTPLLIMLLAVVAVVLIYRRSLHKNSTVDLIPLKSF